jgi:hypothetical protein
MLVIVPTRGRPDNVARLEQARFDTGTASPFLYVIDSDDPELDGYRALGLSRFVVLGSRLRLGPTLNEAVRRYGDRWEAIGFMGDDHLPRTEGWDRRILAALDSPDPRVVYGNDLLQGANLPTAVFMHARIARSVGYFCPPDQVHLYLDNYWKELGERLAGLVYLDDVVIEHMHPVAGKAEWDDRYAEVNAPTMDVTDRDAWLHYRASGEFEAAVQRVKEAYLP